MIVYTPLLKTMQKENVSLDELASGIGKSENKLRDILNNGLYISMYDLDRICGLLGCDVNGVISRINGVQNISAKKYLVDWDRVQEEASKQEMSITKLSLECRLSPTALIQMRKRGKPVKESYVKMISSVLGVDVKEIGEEI